MTFLNVVFNNLSTIEKIIFYHFPLNNELMKDLFTMLTKLPQAVKSLRLCDNQLCEAAIPLLGKSLRIPTAN